MTIEQAGPGNKNIPVGKAIVRESTPQELPPDIRKRISSESGKLKAPIDPSIDIEKMDNGLSLYVKENTNVSEAPDILMLAVKAGAAYEPASFPGLTHILAHVIQDHFRSVMGQGRPDDKSPTVSIGYESILLSVPIAKGDNSMGAISFLRDCANHLPLTGATIDRAKRESLNCQLHPGTKENVQIAKKLYQGSKYATHFPYFSGTSLLSIPDDTLIRYYQVFFRPENQAVIAIGRFSGYEMVHTLQEELSSISKATEAFSLKKDKVPFHTRSRILIFPEEGARSTHIEIVQHRPHIPLNTFGGYVKSIRWKLFERLWEKTMEEHIPNISQPKIHIGWDVDGLDRCKMEISSKTPADPALLLSQILAQNKAIVAEGFDAKELEKAKEWLRAKVNSDDFLKASNYDWGRWCADNFVYGTAAPSPAQARSATEGQIRDLDTEDMKAIAKIWFSRRNRSVILYSPASFHITENEVSQILR